MDLGIGLCAAQMLGAKMFNEKNNKKVDLIYGCVTNGINWNFLKLKNQHLTIDENLFFISEIEKLLGAFQTIIEYYKSTGLFNHQ